MSKTFAQIVESLKGTYIGVRFDKSSLDMLKSLQKDLSIPNPTPVSDMHSTVIFSRNQIDFPVEKSVNEKVSPDVKFHIFTTKSGKRALVLLIDSDYLRARHELGNQLGATYDFPDYQPHVTLSYDVGDRKYPTKKFKLDKELVIASEYHEELDLDWKPKG